MDPDQARGIVDWPRCTFQNEVQQLLGLWIFYRQFIPSYAAIVAPITDLFRGDKKKFYWGESQEVAFLKIAILVTSGKTQ